MRLNRVATTNKILDLIRGHELIPNTVTVAFAFPGQAIQGEAIWVESIEGEIDWPVMQAANSRRPFDDRYEIALAVSLVKSADEATALVRIEELTAACIEVVQANLDVIRLVDGVLDVDVDSAAFFSGDTKTAGQVGRGQVVIAVHSRIN